jgi:hypothetical protein
MEDPLIASLPRPHRANALERRPVHLRRGCQACRRGRSPHWQSAPGGA